MLRSVCFFRNLSEQSLCRMCCVSQILEQSRWDVLQWSLLDFRCLKRWGMEAVDGLSTETGTMRDENKLNEEQQRNAMVIFCRRIGEIGLAPETDSFEERNLTVPPYPGVSSGRSED